MRRRNVSYAKYGYLFSLPFILAFLVFALYPTLYTAFIGFTNMKGVIPPPVEILPNPLQNFKDLLFNNPLFRQTLINTALIWVLNFIPQIVMALLLAAWFTNRRLNIRGQGGFKVLLYMPNIITAGTIAVLFSALFSYPMGPVNSFFELMGWSDSPVNFLQSKSTARGIVAFIQFWMWYGNTMIVLIAGIAGINPALFESAQIDGANGIQTFFKITLPSLRTIILFVLVTSMVGGLQMFDIPQLFLNGGPDNATRTAAVFIYDQAFTGNYLYNRAAAASMILFVIAAVLSSFLFYILRDRDAAAVRRAERRLARQARRAKLDASGGVTK